MRGAPAPFSSATAEAGFTIVEMLVVLGIMAVAMTGVPAIVAGMDASRLRAAADEMVTALRDTRGQAVRQGAAREMVLDPQRLGYTTASGFRALPQVVKALDVPRDRLDDKGLARIRFAADGTATPARITLRAGSRSASIAVDWLTGRVHADD